MPRDNDKNGNLAIEDLDQGGLFDKDASEEGGIAVRAQSLPARKRVGRTVGKNRGGSPIHSK